MRATKIVTFAGSTRTGSYSAALSALAAKEIALLEAEPVHLSLADYALPIYDGDCETREGVPENAKRLHRQLVAADGVFVVTPEYNAGFPPLLKNAIDWVSRVRGEGDAFGGPAWAIGCTSPGALGGYRASQMLRQSLALGLNCLILGEQAMVANASQAFDEAGNFKDDKQTARLRGVLKKLIELSALRAGLRA